MKGREVMATYEIDVTKAVVAAGHLNETITELEMQIRELNKIQETMLNDSLWKGPNKTDFTNKFEAYKTALTALYANSVEHYNHLNDIIQTYVNAETV